MIFQPWLGTLLLSLVVAGLEKHGLKRYKEKIFSVRYAQHHTAYTLADQFRLVEQNILDKHIITFYSHFGKLMCCGAIAFMECHTALVRVKMGCSHFQMYQFHIQNI